MVGMATPTTVEEIQTLMMMTFTDEQAAACQLLITLAEGEIEGFLGRPIQPTSFEDEQVFPDANGSVYLKNTPVITIDELTVNDEVKGTDFFTATEYGMDNIWEMWWNYVPVDMEHVPTDLVYGGRIVVSYTAGLDYPQAIKSLVIAGVMNKMREFITKANKDSQNAAGVKRLKIEDYEIEWEAGSSYSSSPSAAGSNITIFQSDKDFLSIKQWRKIRT